MSVCSLYLRFIIDLSPPVCFHLSASQSMVVGPLGLVGLIVLVHALMTSVKAVQSLPECAIAPVLTPPHLITRSHLATVAMEKASRCRTAVNFPTAQVGVDLINDLIDRSS